MRRKLFGIFSSVDDAKNTLGLLKKQSLNQADFVVIIGETQTNRSKDSNLFYETAGENFLADRQPTTGPQIAQIWPGLKEVEFTGLGTVKVGYSAPEEDADQLILHQKLGDADLKMVEREISARKVVAFIEADEQFLPKLRQIMATSGAELIEE